jgi:hypothetical protein
MGRDHAQCGSAAGPGLRHGQEPIDEGRGPAVDEGAGMAASATTSRLVPPVPTLGSIHHDPPSSSRAASMKVKS